MSPSTHVGTPDSAVFNHQIFIFNLGHPCRQVKKILCWTVQILILLSYPQVVKTKRAFLITDFGKRGK